mmetsp:Transcript_55984/g.98161  ORF Transcript_55984/g.98161 Transcript_55984/m.98161 type:complete len:368 (+) Transcript_55984:49-1152(+)
MYQRVRQSQCSRIVRRIVRRRKIPVFRHVRVRVAVPHPIRQVNVLLFRHPHQRLAFVRLEVVQKHRRLVPNAVFNATVIAPQVADLLLHNLVLQTSLGDVHVGLQAGIALAALEFFLPKIDFRLGDQVTGDPLRGLVDQRWIVLGIGGQERVIFAPVTGARLAASTHTEPGPIRGTCVHRALARGEIRVGIDFLNAHALRGILHLAHGILSHDLRVEIRVLGLIVVVENLLFEFQRRGVMLGAAVLTGNAADKVSVGYRSIFVSGRVGKIARLGAHPARVSRRDRRVRRTIRIVLIRGRIVCLLAACRSRHIDWTQLRGCAAGVSGTAECGHAGTRGHHRFARRGYERGGRFAVCPTQRSVGRHRQW